VEVSAKTGEFVNEAIMSLITGKLEVSASSQGLYQMKDKKKERNKGER
jgi:hypothetical protein